MANAFDIYAGGLPAFPTGLTGQTIESRRTPESAFAYSQAQMQPFWSRRTPSAISPMLRSRYLLGATPTVSALGSYQEPQTFSAFLRSPQMRNRLSQADLLQRARLAGAASQMSPMGFLGQFAPGGYAPNPAEFARRSALYQQFGPQSPDMIQNQLAVANLLARQAPGGQAYSGALGDAIDRSIANRYMRYVDAGASPGSFLSGFLGSRRR